MNIKQLTGVCRQFVLAALSCLAPFCVAATVCAEQPAFSRHALPQDFELLGIANTGELIGFKNETTLVRFDASGKNSTVLAENAYQGSGAGYIQRSVNRNGLLIAGQYAQESTLFPSSYDDALYVFTWEAAGAPQLKATVPHGSYLTATCADTDVQAALVGTAVGQSQLVVIRSGTVTNYPLPIDAAVLSCLSDGRVAVTRGVPRYSFGSTNPEGFVVENDGSVSAIAANLLPSPGYITYRITYPGDRFIAAAYDEGNYNLLGSYIVDLKSAPRKISDSEVSGIFPSGELLLVKDVMSVQKQDGTIVPVECYFSNSFKQVLAPYDFSERGKVSASGAIIANFLKKAGWETSDTYAGSRLFILESNSNFSNAKNYCPQITTTLSANCKHLFSETAHQFTRIKGSDMQCAVLVNVRDGQGHPVKNAKVSIMNRGNLTYDAVDAYFAQPRRFVTAGKTNRNGRVLLKAPLASGENFEMLTPFVHRTLRSKSTWFAATFDPAILSY